MIPNCRSLSRPPSHNVEREQAFKLLRAFLDVPQGITFITKGIVKAVVAIAEMGTQGEDRLSGVAVETLAEICTSKQAARANSSGNGHTAGGTIVRIATVVTKSSRWTRRVICDFATPLTLHLGLSRYPTLSIPRRSCSWTISTGSSVIRPYKCH